MLIAIHHSIFVWIVNWDERFSAFMCNNVNDLLDAIMKRDGELMERSKQKKNT